MCIRDMTHVCHVYMISVLALDGKMVFHAMRHVFYVCGMSCMYAAKMMFDETSSYAYIVDDLSHTLTHT